MPEIKIGSQTIFYEEHGNGEAVILLSGLGANRLSWRKQIIPFSNKYRVFNVDNRDAGNSGQSTNSYDIIDMSNDIAGLIECLDLSSVYVIGISMGSFIAQYLALKLPQTVKKIVLVSSSSGGKTHVYPKHKIFSLY